MKLVKKIIDKRESKYLNEALKLRNYYEDVIIYDIIIDFQNVSLSGYLVNQH